MLRLVNNLLITIFVYRTFILLVSGMMLTLTDDAPVIAVDPSNDSSFPLTPGPENCIAEPVSFSKLAELSATPIPTPPPIDLQASDALDDEGREVVEKTIIEVFACLNAGEPLRAYALYTHDYLVRVAAREQLELLATPAVVLPDERTTIIDIRDVRELTDGRAYAVVILDPALIPVQKIYGFVLAGVDGEWLVDDVLDELRFSLP